MEKCKGCAFEEQPYQCEEQCFWNGENCFVLTAEVFKTDETEETNEVNDATQI